MQRAMTYLVRMKIIPLAFAMSALPLWGQISLPCDFETTPTTADFTDFDGGVASVVPNPAPDATNSSANVAQIVRGPGALWAGSYLTLDAPAAFGELSGLRMSVWSPEPNVFMRIKFESTQGAVERDAWLSTSGAWTVLEWDFSNMPSGLYDRLVFMFDVGTEGDATANSTFYFDDVTWFDADGDLAAPDLPISWDEEGIHYHPFGFEGSAVWLSDDLQDPGNTVMEVLKTGLALDYSGVVLTNRNGLENPIAFTTEHQVIRARVWSPDVALPILMKVEDKDDPSVFVQTLVTTETVGWDTLEFDFSQPTEGSPALDFTASYDLPVVFFNFGYSGAVFGPLTFRLDDVELLGAQTSSHVAPIAGGMQLIANVVRPGEQLIWSTEAWHGAELRWFDGSGRQVGVTRLHGAQTPVPHLPEGLYLLGGIAPDGTLVQERVFLAH